MRSIKLHRADGSVIAEAMLPDTPDELPLARYVSFIAEAAKIQIPGTNTALAMAKAVSEFTGVPFHDLLQAEYGGEYWRSDTRGIQGIYAWAVDCVGRWKGSECSGRFTYRDQTFDIPVIFQKAIVGSILPDITVNEAIEVQETVRLFSDQIQKSASVRECAAMLLTGQDAKDIEPYYKRLCAIVPEAKSIDLTNIDVPAVERIIVSHGDPDGNYTFTRYLRVLAILCRMPGESLPHAEREKRAFIAERMQFFEGIDTKTALDVDFFLLNILTACEMILPVIGSLILPAFAVVAEMSAWNERHIPGL